MRVYELAEAFQGKVPGMRRVYGREREQAGLCRTTVRICAGAEK